MIPRVLSSFFCLILLPSLCWGSEFFMTGVRLDLQWYPQSQFAGYYVAYEKGMYLRRGLNVFVYRGGPDRDPMEALRRREADFVTAFLTGAMVYRERGLPLVNLAQVVNEGNLLLVAQKKDGISEIFDLDGKRISMWGDHFSGAYRGFFTAHCISPEIVPQFYSIDLFLRGGVVACSAMSYNEYNRILQAGYRQEDLTVISLKDEGFGFPEDGIYCLESTLKDHPTVCRDFVRASLEGWRYTAEHPEEAVDIVMKYAKRANVPANRVHMKRMLETILPSIVPDSSDLWSFGRLSMSDYLDTAFMMEERGLIGKVVPFDDFVKTVFEDED
ncbi:ABC transporter substrate-binding protein [Dethiosulfovibrio sp. F2B]|uniref:ABC transporter substrate-binding protein n=1 Tax=Dethiosulfovibrio faecalis TaxID=2720018 RepID=UPI001F28B6CC|nr:ABC transporter substrate-binding protein [Dethiosulfovibrio faecalis]MCF4151422.1 ABC transporter substrate-binding protein [Dethiosulfovibrio faecalis]